MRIFDLLCHDCGLLERDVCVTYPTLPPCPCCAAARSWLPFVPKTDVKGSAVFYNGLDREFTSHSEAMSWAKQNGYEQAPSADKDGGARNESHLGIGKTLYSLPSQNRGE